MSNSISVVNGMSVIATITGIGIGYYSDMHNPEPSGLTVPFTLEGRGVES